MQMFCQAERKGCHQSRETEHVVSTYESQIQSPTSPGKDSQVEGDVKDLCHSYYSSRSMWNLPRVKPMLCVRAEGPHIKVAKRKKGWGTGAWKGRGEPSLPAWGRTAALDGLMGGFGRWQLQTFLSS